MRAIISERDRLFEELKKIQGLSPIKSEANFMIAKATVGPKQIFDELIKKDILVRDVSSYPMLSEYFRISVGTPEENDLLVEALRTILQ